MIRTVDNRKFFTYKQNFNQIENFAKLFKAEVSIVEIKEANILDLKALAPAICNKDYKDNQNYNLIKIKLPKINKRRNILYNSKKIDNYIRDNLKKGKSLSLKEIKNQFKNLKVTNSCLCNHFKKIRENMQKEGFKFKKISGGTYKKQM